MVMTQGGCDERVKELAQWLDSLPLGVARLDIARVPDRAEYVLDLVPIDNLAAARMRLEVCSTNVALRAGQRFWIPAVDCSQESLVPYCRAIVEGDLAEAALLRRGEVVGWETALPVGRKRLVGRRFFEPTHERWWTGRLRWFRRGRKRRSINYSPYYELVPLASDSTQSVLIKPPVFQTHSDWAAVYPSARDVEDHLEPWYLDEANHKPWCDSAGRLLRIIGSDPDVKDWREWWVKVQCVQPEPMHVDELRQALRGLLSLHGLPKDWLSRASLEELAARALEYSFE